MLRSLYDRLFLTLYLLMLKTPSRRTADDSAAKLVVIALFFYTVPLVIYALDAIAGSHIPYAVFFTIIFGYGVLIYWLNMRYFLGRGRLKYIISNYKISPPKKMVGASELCACCTHCCLKPTFIFSNLAKNSLNRNEKRV
jgi:hypothetical protein